jgi:hypothetical protein
MLDSESPLQSGMLADPVAVNEKETVCQMKGLCL